MSHMETIPLPKGDPPISALAGFSTHALDADPDAALASLAQHPFQQIVSVARVVFHGTTPGYLVVTQDRGAV